MAIIEGEFLQKIELEERLGQLEKRKGGYYFFKIEAKTVDQFAQKRKSRFICTIKNQLSFHCGLNHLGDGHFFIIVSTKCIKELNLKLGELVPFVLEIDSDPLGMPMPEVMQVIFEQNDTIKANFDALTIGQKRSVMASIAKIKSIDLQIARVPELIYKVTLPRIKKA